MKDFGMAEQLYRKPRTLEGAQFLGKVNCIPRECYGYFKLDEKDRVYCRPEDLDIRANSKGSATVEQRFFNGKFYKYIIRVKDFQLEVYSLEENLWPGNPLDIVLKEYFQFPEDQEKSI